eukprot:scaffold522_cov168-Amphora_coffeaeformis.AAC.12
MCLVLVVKFVVGQYPNGCSSDFHVGFVQYSRRTGEQGDIAVRCGLCVSMIHQGNPVELILSRQLQRGNVVRVALNVRSVIRRVGTVTETLRKILDAVQAFNVKRCKRNPIHGDSLVLITVLKSIKEVCLKAGKGLSKERGFMDTVDMMAFFVGWFR